MSEFRVSLLQNSSVLFIYTERDSIQLDPEYQRAGDIWTLEKKQLLIDSIINGYDIPKIYFHEFSPPKKINGNTYRYSIIDGKQRLESLWGFIDGDFTLSNDFEYLHDPHIKAAGLTYSELATKYPRLKVRFDSITLSVVAIQTIDTELIEDMFSRLNEAVPLNAAEKRNAFGGPLPNAIRVVAQHRFFTTKLPFPNTRYRHFDLAAKFLYLEHRDGPADTKKVYLDQFVKDYKKNSVEQVKVNNLVEQTMKVLDYMASTFSNSDKLLGSIGMITVYYLLFRQAIKGQWTHSLSRGILQLFEEVRLANRELAEIGGIADTSYQLLEFDRLAWTPNDGVSITFRRDLLVEMLDPNGSKFVDLGLMRDHLRNLRIQVIKMAKQLNVGPSTEIGDL
jgi:Protein of unknown function DUF262